MKDVLPDCRQHNHTPRNSVNGPGGLWIPFYCANCGDEGGRCPEASMTFMFYLCNKCFQTYGEVAGVMMVPDQAFYDRVVNEQKEKHGRLLSPIELQQVVAEDSSALAKLLKEGK